MNVVLNGENILYDWCEVDISQGVFTRQYTFYDVSDKKNYSNGDYVEIYDENGVLLVAGEIEKTIIDDGAFVYAGRNNAKYIVDCHSDKTIQFSEGQSVQSVLEEVASSFGLKVLGSAKMPTDAIIKILIGDVYGAFFINVAKNAGQLISSDAIGNLIIESRGEEGAAVFEYGVNIRSREYVEDSTAEFDRYVVVSQSNYMVTGKQDVYVRGEYGSGKFVKALRSSENLTEAECEEVAKNEYLKDRRRSLVYAVEIDRSEKVELNKEYMVTDEVVSIGGMMNVKRIIETASAVEDKRIVHFERVKGG
jgi:prophage tail gpP-like protein